MRPLIGCLLLAFMLLPVGALAQAQAQDRDPVVPAGMCALCLTSNWRGLEAPLTVASEGSIQVLLGSPGSDSNLLRTPAIVFVPLVDVYGLAVYSRIPSVEFTVRDCTPGSTLGDAERWPATGPVGGFTRVGGPPVSAEALVVLDGVRISREELEALPVGSLESIEIVRGSRAIERFGTEGRNGVVIGITRQANRTPQAELP